MDEPVGNTNEKTRAPLRNGDLPPKSSAAGKYFVYLTPGYTLEDHKRTVGTETLPVDSIEQVKKLVVERATANHIANALSENSIEQVVNQGAMYTMSLSLAKAPEMRSGWILKYGLSSVVLSDTSMMIDGCFS